MNKKPVDYYDRIADALQILTGDDSNVDTESPTMDYYDRIANALEALAENGGGGSGLPAVTSDDNGDVLTVVEGAWAKADPPSSLPAVTGSDNGDVLTVVEGAWAKATPSGMVLIVHVSDDDTPVLDKTWQEINDASYAVLVWDGQYFPILGIGHDESSYGVAFLNFSNPENPGISFAANSADGYPNYLTD